MKKDISKKIEIPEGLTVKLDGTTLIINGEKGENKRNFYHPKIDLEKKGNEIILTCNNASKDDKMILHTFFAHILNMIYGSMEGFEYELKVCSSHFPVTLEQQGNLIKVKNFFGEKIPRIVEIPQGVEVKIEKDLVKVSSSNKELAGQASANFEATTKLKTKDRRVFQDGIYITSKPRRNK